MKIRSHILVSLIFFGLSSCQKGYDFEKSPTGLQYHFFTNNAGGKVGKIGDFYSMNVTAMGDTILFSTFLDLERVEPLYKGDVHEGLAMLHKGDSVVFLLPADSFFSNAGKPVPENLKGGTVMLHIGVLDIRNPFEQTIFKSEEEIKIMENFVKNEGWQNVVLDTTGIYYQKIGENPNAEPILIGDSVDINYTYSLLNRRVLWQTKDNDPWRFEVGGNQTRISGLSRVLVLMNDGDHVRALLPFTEAFGIQGLSDFIPPCSTIVLDIKAKKVKK
ncbi:MAG: FKBP-type peptidyl-prolyl cis-trans isomerase [Flavobacteriales bacterium]|nr:FKBP-type peptidyl-prolyl cis-trans isomerase [Flavobacteriales bacterium]